MLFFFSLLLYRRDPQKRKYVHAHVHISTRLFGLFAAVAIFFSVLLPQRPPPPDRIYSDQTKEMRSKMLAFWCFMRNLFITFHNRRGTTY